MSEKLYEQFNFIIVNVKEEQAIPGMFAFLHVPVTLEI